jgi:hypothetical protein
MLRTLLYRGWKSASIWFQHAQGDSPQIQWRGRSRLRSRPVPCTLCVAHDDISIGFDFLHAEVGG